MQLDALAGEEVVVQRLAQQCVTEAETAVFVGLEHLLGDGLAQRGVQRAMFDAGGLADHRLVQGPADGDDPGGALGHFGQALDPQHECVAQALGRGAAAVEARRQQLLGVQRIALAALEHALDQIRAGRVAENVGERLGQLGAIERRQLDALRALEAIELGQERAQRMAAVKLVAAVGQKHHHALLAKAARQESRERASRAVRPVHVLENQHDRLELAQQIEQLEHGLEQAQLAGGLVRI